MEAYKPLRHRAQHDAAKVKLHVPSSFTAIEHPQDPFRQKNSLIEHRTVTDARFQAAYIRAPKAPTNTIPSVTYLTAPPISCQNNKAVFYACPVCDSDVQLSWSRFEGSLPYSQKPATSPCTQESVQIHSHNPFS